MVTGLTHSLHVFPAEEKARESRRGYRYLVCSSDHSIFIKLAITMLASHPPPFTPLSWRGNKPEQPDGLAAPQTAFCFRHGVGWSSTARPPRCCLEGERTWRPNFLFFLCTIDVPVDGEEPDASVRPLESDVESSFSFAPVPPPRMLQIEMRSPDICFRNQRQACGGKAHRERDGTRRSGMTLWR